MKNNCVFVVLIIFFSLIILTGFMPACKSDIRPKNNIYLDLFSLRSTEMSKVPCIIIDYQQIKSVTGLSVSGLTNDEVNTTLKNTFDKGYVDEILALKAGSQFTGWGMRYGSFKSGDEYLGFSPNDVQYEIDNFLTKNTSVAAIGQYVSSKTKSSFELQKEWPNWAKSSILAEKYNGFEIYSWENVQNYPEDGYSSPMVDESGKINPIAIKDGKLMISETVNDLRSTIDASYSSQLNLAGNEAFQLAGQGLLDLKPYVSTVFSEPGVEYFYESPKEYSGPQLKPFIVISSGKGLDQKGEYLSLILVHKTAREADENVNLLKQQVKATSWWFKQPWPELVYDSNIVSKGKILEAKLYTKKSFLWAQLPRIIFEHNANLP
jgi:hypothetical protein